MPKQNANLSLKSYDDIFSTQEQRDEKEGTLEHVQQLDISKLVPFSGHPLKVRDDEEMEKTVDSIKQFGVLNPVIVRPMDNGLFEIVSGHRRCHASALAGLESVPGIVRNLDDDEATILMVDSNLQRETILPSERAMALKMKYDAIKHQGARHDITSCQLGTKLRTDELLAEGTNESARTIQRYMKLNDLIPELLDMVDDKRISFNPAVELAYIPQEKQKEFLVAMDYAQSTPSLSQAQRIKKLSQEGMCTLEAMCAVMDEEKKPELDNVVLKQNVLKKYFPKSYTPKQMEDQIIKLLDQWQKKRQRQESL